MDVSSRPKRVTVRPFHKDLVVFWLRGQIFEDEKSDGEEEDEEDLELS